jgi:hypothetical protein
MYTRMRDTDGSSRTFWKVPFRQVYCESFLSAIKQTFWCHVVIRVFPNVHDFGSDALVDLYIDEPETLFDQFEWVLKKVQNEREQLASN